MHSSKEHNSESVPDIPMKDLCLAFLHSGDSPEDRKQRERAALLMSGLLELPHSRSDEASRSRFFDVCDGFDDALVELKESNTEYPDLDDTAVRRLNELALLAADHDSSGWNIRALLDRLAGAISEGNIDALYESLAGERGVPVVPENPEKGMVSVAWMTIPPRRFETTERLSMLARGIARSPSALPAGHAVSAASNVSWKALRERGIGRMIAGAFASSGKREASERRSAYASEFAKIRDRSSVSFLLALQGTLLAACCCGEFPDEIIAKTMEQAEKLSPGAPADALFRVLIADMYPEPGAWLAYASLLPEHGLTSNLKRTNECACFVAELLVADAEEGMTREKSGVHERLLEKCGREVFGISGGEYERRYVAAVAAETETESADCCVPVL